MKKLVAILALTLSLMLSVTSLTGCGKKYEDNEDTVVVDFFEGGYGRDFIEDMKKEFEAQNPGKTIYIKGTTLRNKIPDSIKAGPKANDADLFMTNGTMYELLGLGSMFGNDYLLEPLTEVYDQKVEGDKTIRDLTMKSYYDSALFNKTEYSMIWSAGMQGLIYHSDVLAEKDIPKTTNDLIAVSEKLKSEGKKAFIYSGNVDYWNPIHLLWWAQYEGLENYFRFYDGQAAVKNPITGEESIAYSSEIFAQKGRREALNVMEELLHPDNDYCDPTSTALSFSDAQIKFLEKKAVMHPNGDWLENEASDKFEPGSLNIKFMKTPVISALGAKLGITENELKATIDFVDGAGNEPVYANASLDKQKIIDEVRSARNMVYLSATTHIAGIPAYANAKPLAKDFLKFMYSREGAKIFTKATKGNTLPINYDFSKDSEFNYYFSGFQKSKTAILNEKSVGIYQKGSHQISYKGGLRPYGYNSGVLEAAFGASNAKDRKTAEQIIAYDLTTYDSTGWQNLLKRAGLV